MPTYTLTTTANRLTPAQKARLAAEITRVHNQLMRAATFFAQVIIHEVPEGSYFVGGKPLQGDQVFLLGQVRTGRSAVDRKALLQALRDVVAETTGVPLNRAWVYLVDVPARDMIEYGHILPEPGDETSWMEGLPEQDRALMLATGA